jgi:hypothetical protein
MLNGGKDTHGTTGPESGLSLKLPAMHAYFKLKCMHTSRHTETKSSHKNNKRSLACHKTQKLKISVPSSMAKIGYEDPLSYLVNAIALFFARWPGPRASKCRRR